MLRPQNRYHCCNPTDSLSKGTEKSPRKAFERFLEHLSQHFFYNPAGHIRQAMLAAAVEIRQTLVVDAQQVQRGSVEIVNVDFVFHRGVAELIGSAEDLS